MLFRSQILAGKGGALFGKADVVSAAQGYVDFDETGAAYQALPESLRTAFEKELAALRKGTLSFPVNGL